jgi:hypothetical protein
VNDAFNQAAHFEPAQQSTSNITICEGAKQSAIFGHDDHDLKRRTIKAAYGLM